MMNKRKLFFELIKYTGASGVALVVDAGLLYVLTEYVDIHYQISALIGFTSGLLIVYIASTRWIFEARTLENRTAEIILFTVIGLVGILLNQFLLFLFFERLGVALLVAKGGTVVFVFSWNFLVRKFLLFNRPHA